MASALLAAASGWERYNHLTGMGVNDGLAGERVISTALQVGIPSGAYAAVWLAYVIGNGSRPKDELRHW